MLYFRFVEIFFDLPSLNDSGDSGMWTANMN